MRLRPAYPTPAQHPQCLKRPECTPESQCCTAFPDPCSRPFPRCPSRTPLSRAARPCSARPQCRASVGRTAHRSRRRNLRRPEAQRPCACSLPAFPRPHGFCAPPLRSPPVRFSVSRRSPPGSAHLLRHTSCALRPRCAQSPGTAQIRPPPLRRSCGVPTRPKAHRPRRLRSSRAQRPPRCSVKSDCAHSRHSRSRRNPLPPDWPESRPESAFRRRSGCRTPKACPSCVCPQPCRQTCCTSCPRGLRPLRARGPQSHPESHARVPLPVRRGSWNCSAPSCTPQHPTRRRATSVYSSAPPACSCSRSRASPAPQRLRPEYRPRCPAESPACPRAPPAVLQPRCDMRCCFHKRDFPAHCPRPPVRSARPPSCERAYRPQPRRS